jgi:hypothetical protein
MTAGLQVRQHRGESLDSLIKSLPYGSILKLEANTHLYIAERQRELKCQLYKNQRGNICLASLQTQIGIIPPTLKEDHVLVTVNGASITNLNQAFQLLCLPEKLLLVLADPPLDKTERQQYKARLRVDCQMLQASSIPTYSLGTPQEIQNTKPKKRTKNEHTSPPKVDNDKFENLPSQESENSLDFISKSFKKAKGEKEKDSPDKVADFIHIEPKYKRIVVPEKLPDTPKTIQSTFQDVETSVSTPTTSDKVKSHDSSCSETEIISISSNDPRGSEQYDKTEQRTSVISPLATSTTLQKQFGEVSRIVDEDDDHPVLFVSDSWHDANDDYSISPREPVVKKLDQFLDNTMMELAYVVVELEDLQQNFEGVLPENIMSTEELQALENRLKSKISHILEKKQAFLMNPEPSKANIIARLQQQLKVSFVEIETLRETLAVKELELRQMHFNHDLAEQKIRMPMKPQMKLQ